MIVGIIFVTYSRSDNVRLTSPVESQENPSSISTEVRALTQFSGQNKSRIHDSLIPSADAILLCERSRPGRPFELSQARCIAEIRPRSDLLPPKWTLEKIRSFGVCSIDDPTVSVNAYKFKQQAWMNIAKILPIQLPKHYGTQGMYRIEL